MKKRTTLFQPLLALSAALFATVSLSAQPVSVEVKTSEPGPEIAPQMVGLSYETSLLRPNESGVRYFRPDNKALVTLFKTIGVNSLRIGGASTDSTKKPFPSEEDIASLFDFAKEAGTTVIFSVRGGDSKEIKVADNVALATRAAKLIHSRYKDQLDLFAIGNEPYYWLREHDRYVKKWAKLRDGILAGFPEAKLCAADEGPMPELVRMMALAYGNPEGHLAAISQHSYPFGSSYKNNTDPSDLVNRTPHDATESRAKMLSPAAYKIYEKIHRDLLAALKDNPLPYRLTETNSYSSSGLKGASDSFASALWATDYMYWWANHGMSGMNFHTGDRTGGDVNFICRYAAFRTNENGYDVHPLSYGMKLFALGRDGQTLPAAVKAAADQNLVAYATLAKDKTISVTLINKSYGSEAKEQLVKVKLDQPLDGRQARIIRMQCRDNDISLGLGDVTLGGEPIKADGTWDGRWSDVPASDITKDEIVVKMQPASAALLKLGTR